MILQGVFGILIVEFKDLSSCLDHQLEAAEEDNSVLMPRGGSSKHKIHTHEP
jgi:hypothetical protein